MPNTVLLDKKDIHSGRGVILKIGFTFAEDGLNLGPPVEHVDRDGVGGPHSWLALIAAAVTLSQPEISKIILELRLISPLH